MEKKEGSGNTSIKIECNMQNFEGVTAHMFQVVSSGTEARLDCIYVDRAAVVSGASEAPGKVVARINMSTSRLRELRDTLNNHISDD